MVMKLRWLLFLGVVASCRAADLAPNPTLDALLAEKDRWHQLKGMLDYADTLSAPQAADAVHYIEAHNISESHDEALQLFVHRWAELDPAACVIFAEPGVAKRQQANPARSERKQR